MKKAEADAKSLRLKKPVDRHAATNYAAPITKAPPPIEPLPDRPLQLSGYGFKFDKPDWERWRRIDRVRLWEGACLVADIEPPISGDRDGIWAEYQLKEFPAEFQLVWEVVNRDELLTRLPIQPYSGRMLHHADIEWFACWAISKNLVIPEPLKRMAEESAKRQAQKEDLPSSARFTANISRADLLHPLIVDAIHASGGLDSSKVFSILRDWALEEKAPFGGVDGQGLLMWTDANGKSKTLSKKALGLRLNRLRD